MIRARLNARFFRKWGRFIGLCAFLALILFLAAVNPALQRALGQSAASDGGAGTSIDVLRERQRAIGVALRTPSGSQPPVPTTEPAPPSRTDLLAEYIGLEEQVRQLAQADMDRWAAFARAILVALGALVVGAVFGTGIGYGIEYRDGTFRTARQVEAALELSVLAGILAARGIAAQKPPVRIPAPASDGYKALAARLMPGDDAAMAHENSFLITSAGRGEGKSLSTLQLGIATCEFGKRVLIVDADLRTPALHRYSGVSNREGFANMVIQYAVSMENQIEPLVEAYIKPVPGFSGLWVLSSGPIPAEPNDLLGLAKLPALLTALSHNFDLVLIDAPAVLDRGDALPLVRLVDGVLFVVDARRTRRREAKQALRLITQKQGAVRGVLLNRVGR